MQALIIIDAQNEFSEKGQRAVKNFNEVVAVINDRVMEAREQNIPIAWIKHFNRPDESPAFIPGTWGSEFHEGFGPLKGSGIEMEFRKDVYGAFTGTNVGAWLKKLNVESVFICGFYTHACVSTTAREALMSDLNVVVDPNATGTCDISHEIFGVMDASEVHRSALMQLSDLGVTLSKFYADSNSLSESIS